MTQEQFELRTNNNEAVYSCVWTPIEYNLEHQFQSIESFTEDQGYEKEDIEAIRNLGLSETWIAESPIGAGHMVTRVA